MEPSPDLPNPQGPLTGLRVLDLSRVLAGPSATQMLGDLGADVVKLERPGRGDDTRGWGPPFVKDAAGRETSESAYYLSANRNKRSIAIDIASPAGAALARRLAAKADILVENFKTGDLVRYGLGYGELKGENPGLIYCSITGFGQTGPYAARAGYDFLVQAMGGIMSLTGEPEGEPVKTGVAIADLMAGMYAAVAILAALHHRERTGRGQVIDLALLDTQVAWLSNIAQYFLTGGQLPPRLGNAHPAIVPYQVFAAADAHMVLAVGNDGQFAKFCAIAGRPDIAADPRFATNANRVRHRAVLVPLIADLLKGRPRADWLAALEPAGVPCGPINTLDEVFADPQVQARGMTVAMAHPLAAEPVTLIASPLRLSDSPVSYRHPPPLCGEQTEAVLRDWLALDAAGIGQLRAAGALPPARNP